MSVHSTLINLEKYPIHTDARAVVIENVRKELAIDGCAVLKNFLTPRGIQLISEEIDTVADQGHKSFSKTNPYFTVEDNSLPPSDPRRQFYPRSNAFIAADNFAKNGALRQVHDAIGFDSFIQACLQETHFHRYADPLADVIVNMAEEGQGFPWHFDTNNFTVTLCIQNAEKGGEFEYAPMIRTSENEHFDDVADVLAGKSDKVVRLNLAPGDLQLFRGRYSLHRVLPLKGNTPRYVAIFSYVQAANMVGAPERTKQLYGKVLPIHFQQGAHRTDNLLD